jgi:hypothetical protein
VRHSSAVSGAPERPAQHTDSTRCARRRAGKPHRRTEVARCEYSEYPLRATERAAQARRASPACSRDHLRCEYSEYPCAQRSARRRPDTQHLHAAATTSGVSTPSTHARNGARGAGPTRSICMQPQPPPVCGKAGHKRTHSQSNQCQYCHRCGRIGPSPVADVAGACRCGTGPYGADVAGGEHSPW